MGFNRSVFALLLLTGQIHANTLPETEPAQSVQQEQRESTLPEPPDGFKWQTVAEMSDEFDGESLDKEKWNDFVGGWRGRPPAEFLPRNVSVANGHLRIKTSTHPEPNGPYTIAGGGVSGKHQQTYGYFEARIKASKTKMSTTFWLHSDKDETPREGCKYKHRIELDILEAIGGWPKPQWSNVMNSNTHYKPFEFTELGCLGQKYLSKGNKHDTGVNLSEDFHTFASWWTSANRFHFYFDDEQVGTVFVSHERDPRSFNGPMSLRMVAETYDWQVKFAPPGHAPYPSIAELDDETINTAYYDYVRTYKLVPNSDNLMRNPGFEKASESGGWVMDNNRANIEGIALHGGFGLKVYAHGSAYQKVLVSPQTRYRLSFFARSTMGGAPGAILSIIGEEEQVLGKKQIDGEMFTATTMEIDSGENSEVVISLKNDTRVVSFVDSFNLTQVVSPEQ